MKSVDYIRPIVVLGGGGHAKVIVDVLIASGRTILGFVDRDPNRPPISGIERLGDDADVYAQYAPYDVELANGLGSVGAPGVRMARYIEFKERGYTFTRCIHPRAVISPDTRLSEGVQIMAGSVLQPGVSVGENSIVNTGSTVDHDSVIGAHVHVAPGVTLSGCVSIGDRTHLGTGARVIQQIDIGADCVVAAGSVVVRSLPEGSVVMGVPARPRLRGETEIQIVSMDPVKDAGKKE